MPAGNSTITVPGTGRTWVNSGHTVDIGADALEIECSGLVLWNPNNANGSGWGNMIPEANPAHFPCFVSGDMHPYALGILLLPDGQTPAPHPADPGGQQYAANTLGIVPQQDYPPVTFVSRSWTAAQLAAALPDLSGRARVWYIENDDVPENNEGSFSVETTVTPAPVAAVVLSLSYSCPVGQAVIGTDTYAAALTWTAAPTAMGYRLYRNGVEIYDGPLRAYNDTGRALATGYEYQVEAYNSGYESDLSNAEEALCCLSPGAPAGLEAAYCGCCGVAVSWVAPDTGYLPMIYTLTRNGWVVYQGAVPTFHDDSADRYADSEYAVTATNVCGTGAAAATTAPALWERRPGCSGTEYDRRDSVESVYSRRGAVSTEYGRRDQCDCG